LAHGIGPVADDSIIFGERSHSRNIESGIVAGVIFKNVRSFHIGSPASAVGISVHVQGDSLFLNRMSNIRNTMIAYDIGGISVVPIGIERILLGVSWEVLARPLHEVAAVEGHVGAFLVLPNAELSLGAIYNNLSSNTFLGLAYGIFE